MASALSETLQALQRIAAQKQFDTAKVAHLVEFEADSAGAELLRFVDGRLQRAALGAEPEPVVDQLRVPGHQVILPPHNCTVRPVEQAGKSTCSLLEAPDMG